MPYIIAQPSDIEDLATHTLNEMILSAYGENRLSLHPNSTDTSALLHALSTALPASVHTDQSTDSYDIIDVRPMALTIEQSTNIYKLLAHAPDIQRLWALGTIAHISFHFQAMCFAKDPIFRISIQSTGNNQRVLNLTDAEYAQFIVALPQPPITIDGEDEFAYINIAPDEQITILEALTNNPGGLPSFYEDLPSFYKDLTGFFDEATKFNRCKFGVFPD